MSLALVEPIRRAVEADRITSLATTIARLYEDGALGDPALYPVPGLDRYVRRLVWSDPVRRFVVVAMSWAPGQTTRLHDHDGTWGVEIVVDGTMRETPYRLADRDATGRYGFVREADRTASNGAVSAICPPRDYHTFGNAGTTTARTFHVYGGAMTRCTAFAPERDGWWRSQTMRLAYDA